jgi:hypothetical protein
MAIPINGSSAAPLANRSNGSSAVRVDPSNGSSAAPVASKEVVEVTEIQVITLSEASDRRPSGVATPPAANQKVEFASSLEGEAIEASPKRKKAVLFDCSDSMCPGDRIDFLNEGVWMPGVLRSIDADSVSVSLDADKGAGFVTKGPSNLVRPSSTPQPLTASSRQPQTTSTAPPQVQTAEEVVEVLVEHEQPVKFMSFGDRVELNYNGDWLPGTIESMADGLVYVKCDVDSGTDFVTKAPFEMIRTVDYVQ